MYHIQFITESNDAYDAADAGQTPVQAYQTDTQYKISEIYDIPDVLVSEVIPTSGPFISLPSTHFLVKGPRTDSNIAVENLYIFCHLKAMHLETQKRVIKNSGLNRVARGGHLFQGIIHAMQIYKET